MDTITIESFKRMQLFYLEIKSMYLLSMLILLGACTPSNPKEDLAREFYERAKQYESELPILYNVSFTARGFKDDKPFIPRIEVALKEKETITLPGITKEMTDNDIPEMPFYENISIYANRTGIADSVAYQKVKNYLINITDLAYKLESYKVQSTPRLGQFIIFSLSQKEEVIYIEDIRTVQHDYWKEFFDSGKKLGDKWYYRNTESK